MNKYPSLETKLRAVQAVLGGMPTDSVAHAHQVHRASIYRWKKDYDAHGKKGLLRKSGSGRPRILGSLDNNTLTDIVLASALDYGYESDLWTCRRIRETIEEEFGAKPSQWTVWRRLREADLTYQKPEKKFINASEEERQHWKRYIIPQIKKCTKRYNAILYFQDEANISLTPFLGKTWAPKGKTPQQEVTGNRGGVAAMSAISGVGKLVFKLHKKRIASDEVIDFLKQMLAHHPRRHLVVVMDQAPPHTSKKTKVFIESQKRLHVFHLPKYSPDWNPDEKVWNHLKTQELKGHRAKTRDELHDLTQKKLEDLEQSPRKLRGIFFRCCVADLLH